MARTTVKISDSTGVTIGSVEVTHDVDADRIQVAATARESLRNALFTAHGETFTASDLDEWFA